MTMTTAGRFLFALLVCYHFHWSAAFIASMKDSLVAKGASAIMRDRVDLMKTTGRSAASVNDSDTRVPPVPQHPERMLDVKAKIVGSAPNAVSKSFFQKVKDFQLWPSLFSFAIGYKLGMKVAVKQVSKATDIVAPSTSAAVRTVFLQAALITLISREVWRTIPYWIKRQMPFVRPKTSAVEIDPNDLSSISALSIKLQALFASVSDKLDDGSAEEAAAQTSLLALFMLIAQVKEQVPEFRDRGYDESGIAVDNPAHELQGLDEAFEFADWAYNEFKDDDTLAEALATHKFSLLRHDEVALPGCVAHYIAISKERKTAIISIKGTSSFEDMLTDCCGQSVKHTLNGPFIKDGPTDIYGHEGILMAASRLASDIEMLVDELFLPNNYKLLITGHSLGAGVAAMLGVMLRSKFPALLDDQGDRLKVIAFASPPVLDHAAALACKDFCTTIVNNSDVIPRASVCNLMILVEFLKQVGEKLEEKNMRPRDFESTGAFLRMLTKGSDGQLLMTQEEIRDGMREASQKVKSKDPDHLFVAGKVIHVYDLWKQSSTNDQDDTEVDDGSAKRLRVTDGTSSMLQYIEMDERMIRDHLSPSYRTSIKSFLQT